MFGEDPVGTPIELFIFGYTLIAIAMLHWRALPAALAFTLAYKLNSGDGPRESLAGHALAGAMR